MLYNSYKLNRIRAVIKIRSKRCKIMVRPRRCRRIRFNPEITYYKPRGVPMRDLEEVQLTVEELEALRLKNTKALKQEECAKLMKTSQSTFQRILSSAYQKISEALINGKAIKIIKN